MITLPPKNGTHTGLAPITEKRREKVPTYLIAAACEGLLVAAQARADDGRKAFAEGIRCAVRRIEEVIGQSDAPPSVHVVRVERASCAVEALCVELERAGYSQVEIKLALDGARQERMR